MTIACTVFRCSKQDGMYLYVRRDVKSEDLPPALLRMAGALTRAMDLDLDAARKLARADTAKVMRQLALHGYYLQMPPNG
ncbi:MAG: YcgL domain-containing protein, partial [Stenotrophobium sp.]